MIDLKDINQVKRLKGNIHFLFDSPQGKEVMEFLEEACGWYESVFSNVDRDLILINDGKRQVVATLKSMMRLSPDEIIRMVKSKEE